MAVCVKRLFFPRMENPEWLVEWIEANLLLGVSKIFIYVLHVHRNIAEVLDLYYLKGKLPSLQEVIYQVSKVILGENVK